MTVQINPPIDPRKPYGLLRLLAPAPRQKGDKAWYCRCQCGGEKIVLEKRLRRGTTQSCGCLRRVHRKMPPRRAFCDCGALIRKPRRTFCSRACCEKSWSLKYSSAKQERLCPHCGTSFQSFGALKRFCGDSCRASHWNCDRRRARKVAAGVRYCRRMGCGRELALDSLNRKFCSRTCRIRFNSIKASIRRSERRCSATPAKNVSA